MNDLYATSTNFPPCRYVNQFVIGGKRASSVALSKASTIVPDDADVSFPVCRR